MASEHDGVVVGRISINPDPVPGNPDLPRHSEVVVVGGGIIGVSAAYFLAERGFSVALCEKGIVAGEQSGRNLGWCRTMGRDIVELPLAQHSLRLWRGMSEAIGRETGFRQRGTLYLLDGEDEVIERRRWLDRAAQLGVDSRFVSGAELSALIPTTSRNWIAGLHTPSDGTAEPLKAAPAIAQAAQERGAIILQNCAVRGIETSAGRVSAVVTERGKIDCSAILLAGGVWTRLFCGNLDIDFPQLKVQASAARTSPAPDLADIAAGGSGLSFRRRLDGGYTIALRNAAIAPITPDSFRLFFDFLPAYARMRNDVRLRINQRSWEEIGYRRRWSLDQVTPMETVRTMDPEPSDSHLRQAWSLLTSAFPEFRQLKIEQRWAGLIDVTPDEVPVIDSVKSLPGMWIASGFSGHGFGIGPGAGSLVADLISGGTPAVDPGPYSLSRFKRALAT